MGLSQKMSRPVWINSIANTRSESQKHFLNKGFWLTGCHFNIQTIKESMYACVYTQQSILVNNNNNMVFRPKNYEVKIAEMILNASQAHLNQIR